MNRALVRWLLRVYPRVWRERYGGEFESLLQTGPGGPRAILDVLLSACRERGSPRRMEGIVMSKRPASALLLSRQLNAFLPMSMSIAALAVVLVRVAVAGVARHVDEGAAARTWQLLMFCQGPLIAYFVFKWIRKAPRLVLGVLGIQAALFLAAVAPVYILGL